jgi:NTP pyrophosphatase (non-canonical NTP hydrolase)
MKTRENETDFSDAVERSIQIRKLYNELEKRKHGGPWTNQEDVIGFVHDVGELGRLVMAAEGRWIHPGDLHQDLGDKLSECLWWLFVLSDRLGIDLNTAFSSKMSELEKDLSSSLENTDGSCE